MNPVRARLQALLQEVGAGGLASGAGGGHAAFYKELVAAIWEEPGLVLRVVERVRQEGGWPTAVEPVRWLRLHAHALRYVGRYPESGEAYARAHREFLALGEDHEAGRTCIGWLHVLSAAGEADRAREVAAEGRRQLPASDQRSRAMLEGNLGNLHMERMEYARARRHFQSARRALLAAGLSREAALTAANIALVWLRAGQPRRARRALDEAGRLAGPRPPALVESYLQFHRAVLELALGRWQAGLEQLDRLEPTFASLGDQRAALLLRRERAALWAALGAAGAAVEDLRHCAPRLEEMGAVADAGRARWVLGRLLAAKGERAEAAVELHHARRDFGQVGMDWARDRAELHLARLFAGRGEGRELLARLARLQRRLDRRGGGGEAALCRALRAELHLEAGRPGQAARLLRAARRAAREFPARLERPRMALLVGRCEMARGHRAAALRWARRAATEQEEQLERFGTRHLRTLSADARTGISDPAIELVLEAGGARAASSALDLLGGARAPRLVEDLLHAQVDPVAPQLNAALSHFRDELLAPEATGRGEEARRRATAMVRQLDGELQARRRRFPARVTRAREDRRPRSWRRWLGPRTLVQFQLYGRAVRVFVVRGDAPPQVLELGERVPSLRRLSMEFRLDMEALARTGAGARGARLERGRLPAERLLARLGKELLEALGLPAGEELVLVPDGFLHNLPLEAAMLQLGHDAPVRRLPHPALLRPRPGPRSRRALLLGDGRAGSEEELDLVATRLHAAGWEALRSNRRAALDPAGPPIGLLHIAAHGVFARERWVLSGLRLEDGWLGLEQLPGSRLRGATVVMSSCDSGRSRVLPGGELDGWASAALGLGVGRLLLSLWKIDDGSARRFAAAFYARWLAGADTAAAVAGARQELRRLQPHPFAWGPWVSSG